MPGFRASRRLAALLALLAAPALAPVAGAQITAWFYNQNFQGGVNQPTLAGGFAGTPVCTLTLAAIDFPSIASFQPLAGCPGLGTPANSGHTFAARFTGTLVAPSAGSYTFGFTSDDGVALYVNGAPAFSRWNDQFGVFNQSVTLAAGENPFVLDYYANTFGSTFLTVAPPQGVRFATSVIPEPHTYALLAGGLALLAAGARRRRV